MAESYLALGSNQNDRLANMRAAIMALHAHPKIRVDFETGIAALYETTPVGVSHAQPLYLNSAVRVSTPLAPQALLQAILSIEDSLGRVRRRRGEQRMIDIDLLLYSDLIIEDGDLSLPHPRLHERRFVLEPLCEIAPDCIHPVLELTISALTIQANRCSSPQAITPVCDRRWWHG